MNFLGRSQFRLTAVFLLNLITYIYAGVKLTTDLQYTYILYYPIYAYFYKLDVKLL